MSGQNGVDIGHGVRDYDCDNVGNGYDVNETASGDVGGDGGNANSDLDFVVNSVNGACMVCMKLIFFGSGCCRVNICVSDHGAYNVNFDCHLRIDTYFYFDANCF